MKAAVLILVLIASLGQANAKDVKHDTKETAVIQAELIKASVETIKAWESCLLEREELNCANEVLGDIYN